MRRVLGSFIGRARIPAAFEGTDDWPLHLIKTEYSSLSIKEELNLDHDTFRLEIFHHDQGGSDICFNGIPALSCPTESAESIANELGSEVAKMEIAGLVKEAHSAAMQIRKNASDLFDASQSIIS